MRLTLLTLSLLLVGCTTARQASSVITAQSPGVAQGAGATVIGPTNSGSQTIQVADRKITYQPYISPDLLAVRANVQPQPQALPPGVPQQQFIPVISSVTEHTETTIGSHQDAALLIKVASGIGTWGKARWVGICFIIFGAFAIAWSHNNPEGYPLVAWKFMAGGLFLALFDPSPWWLLVLLVPAGFYAVQKIKPLLP